MDSLAIHQSDNVPTGTVEVKYKSGKADRFNTEDTKKVIKLAEDKSIKYDLFAIEKKSWFMDKIIPIVFGALLFGIVIAMVLSSLLGGMNGGASSANKFGKSRAKVYFPGRGKGKINFDSVAGLTEEKNEVADIVKFLKSPEAYNEAGARIPKRSLACRYPLGQEKHCCKSYSRQAEVAFFSISGSDFVEMFVGVGELSRVRDLFDQAKKNAPCIIFIDEIDAVARKKRSRYWWRSR